MSMGSKKPGTPTASSKSKDPSSDSEVSALEGEELELSEGDVSSKSATNSEPDSDDEELAKIAEVTVWLMVKFTGN